MMGALAITAKALAGHGDRDPGLTGADPLVLGLALLVLGAFAIVYAWSRMRAAEPTPSRPVAPTPRPEPADAAGGI